MKRQTIIRLPEQSGERTSQDLGSTEIVKKVVEIYGDVMETNPITHQLRFPIGKVF